MNINKSKCYDLVTVGICGMQLLKMLNDIFRKKLQEPRVHFSLDRGRRSGIGDFDSDYIIGVYCGGNCEHNAEDRCHFVFIEKGNGCGWVLSQTKANESCRNRKNLLLISKIIKHIVTF
jgi:hypothetical protein